MIIPDIRRINGSCTNLGKIPTCIQVAVHSETTVRALEAVFRAFAQRSTRQPCLAGVGRHTRPLLPLPCTRLRSAFAERPMEPAARGLSRLDAAANVRQAFHRLATPALIAA